MSKKEIRPNTTFNQARKNLEVVKTALTTDINLGNIVDAVVNKVISSQERDFEQLNTKLELIINNTTKKAVRTCNASIVGLDLFKVLYRNQQHIELYRIWLLSQYALLDIITNDQLKLNFLELIKELDSNLKPVVIERMMKVMLDVKADFTRKDSYVKDNFDGSFSSKL